MAIKSYHLSAIYIQNMNMNWSLCKKLFMIKSVNFLVVFLHLVSQVYSDLGNFYNVAMDVHQKAL